MTIFALAIPFVGTAIASHSTDNTHDLQVTPETESNPTGTTHTLIAYVSDCDVQGNNVCEVDFEVESGPAVTVTRTSGGQTTGDSTNTPTSPDMTCVITDAGPDDPDTPFNEQNTLACAVAFTSTTAGTNIIRAWVDDDQDNDTVDADTTEGRYAGPSDCPDLSGTVAGTTAESGDCVETTAQPGSRTEVDDTDVVSKTWFTALPGNARLDCTPETATNPSTGEGSSETYTCQAWQDDGDEVREAGENAIANFEIDGENLNGPNDPDDNAAGGATNTADYGCTTDANGTCQVTVTAAEAQVGTANICFWLDTDRDSNFDVNGPAEDGGECNVETQGEDETGGNDANDNDITDVVSKTWVARGAAAIIDCSPETDQNVRGTDHTVTCVVTDAFGTPVQGTSVDFEVSGRNTALANNRTTDDQGRVSFTYSDSDLPLTQEGQSDIIEGCIDNDATAGCASAAGTDNTDDEDEVVKFWFTTLPVAGGLELDMEDDAGTGGACETGANAEDTATNEVNTTHEVCATVTDAQGNPIAGQEVTFTTSGPGGFWTDTDNDGNVDEGEFNDTTFTTNTNQQGQATATIASNTTGETTVTATSGDQTDSGTKTWTTPDEAGRNIACTPEDATNPPGTTHLVECTVTDRFGNPVPDVDVRATESGPGRFTATGGSSTTATTDENGVVEFVTETTENETGEETITAEIREGAGAGVRGAGTTDDPCEQPEGTTVAVEPGQTGTNQDPAPAGNCADTVTKTWSPDVGPGPVECADGIDNDGDGFIDFPDDPGCESTQDDSEESQGPVVNEGACAGFREGEVALGSPNAGGRNVIVGTQGDDVLNGTSGDDLICALAGDDQVDGHAGNDEIYGDAGADLIIAGDGNDFVSGGDGKDAIEGNDGNDRLDGRGQNDNIRGNNGDDVLWGRNGQDQLRGGSGNDTVRGGANKDVLAGFTGADILAGGADDDILRGKGGRDILRGKTGNDILSGGAGPDTLRGGRGDDLCDGGSGNNSFRGCETTA